MSQRITAVALNPAIDRTVMVPRFAAGITNRVAASRLDPGGKGINVARAARALGAPVEVVGFLGDSNGNLITRSLSAQGIEHRFVMVDGDTRVNLKIVDPDTGELTELNETGFCVSPAHLNELLALVDERLPETAVLVLAGSLPAGVPADIYRRLVERAAAHGVMTILDADGEPMRLGLAASPTLIKPNQAEAEALIKRKLDSREALLQGAAQLQSLGALQVAVSRGADGAVLITPGGAWWGTPPLIHPGSTVGAGDSMVAGFAVAMARGLSPAEALRLATAAGTATASLEGTQVCTAVGVEAVLPQVTVAPIDMRLEANAG